MKNSSFVGECLRGTGRLRITSSSAAIVQRRDGFRLILCGAEILQQPPLMIS